MKVVLDGYINKKICVAVSGGKDSMALLHYLYVHSAEYGITLSALNCDHKIRGEASARDSRFVYNWCKSHGIPLTFFERGEALDKSEQAARSWRLSCYEKALKSGVDAIATAHHLNDNAETVLFNLSRGSALSGMTGIAYENKKSGIIRPLISVSRAEIDEYVKENDVPFVEDETNFQDGYTRNKIRINVLPRLEEAVNGAAKNIYRFSRLAAEDEEYFNKIIEERRLIEKCENGYAVAFCEEKVIFRRAAVKVLEDAGKKDYTFSQANTLYDLQFAESGKKFEFLNLTAYKEGDKIFIRTGAEKKRGVCVPFNEYLSSDCENFGGGFLKICDGEIPCDKAFRLLKFDLKALPDGCVIRFMREGDRFKRFGGGTKSLGDYFTDLKIPVRVRESIPLIACGSEVLIVCGVEISDKVKITGNSEPKYLICKNYKVK